ESLGRTLSLPVQPPALEEIRRVVTIFRELRAGITEDGTKKVNTPTSTLSTAEAISVLNSGLALSAHFGDGVLGARDVAAGIVGAVVKDPVQDQAVWQEYLENVIKSRQGWMDLYNACREVSG
ncbi:MAG: ATPase, partial [Chloroflexota bacterium]